MARLNTATKPDRFTHEGAPAKRINPEQALRRSVMACLLWERSFYEEGEDIAERIGKLCAEVSPEVIRDLAIEARQDMNLRHAPLMLAASMAYNHRGNSAIRETVAKVVQRADELTELPAIVARINGVGPDKIKSVLGAQVKRGLAEAFTKFDAYQLAKYNRKDAITLRDVLFLTHAKPKDKEQESTWKRLVDGTLSAPDTWEANLSKGEDKKATFERMLREGKLGYMALLRNLRGMLEADVDESLIRDAIRARKGAHRVLPFRFVAAARHAPRLEPDLDAALVANIEQAPKLPGRTVVLVDVSASMHSPVSSRSELTRMDAAAALASVIPAESLRVFSFSAGSARTIWDVQRGNVGRVNVEVPPRKGMSGIDAVIRSQNHGGTLLGQAVREANELEYDRLIVITDEQSHDPVPDPKGRGYMINVATYQNGVGYGKWLHIDGFSESVIRYIQAMESDDTLAA